jgi:hypothetical protein
VVHLHELFVHSLRHRNLTAAHCTRLHMEINTLRINLHTAVLHESGLISYSQAAQGRADYPRRLPPYRQPPTALGVFHLMAASCQEAELIALKGSIARSTQSGTLDL